MITKILLATLLSTFTLTKEQREGSDFFVVGDFGWVRDMTDPNSVFDAIDSVKAAAEPNTNDDAQFFMSVGDNIYPRNETNPTDEEWATVMTLFEREHLKDMPVWAIRGNHDCYFDDNFELDKAQEYEQWNMPSFYYEKKIPLGNDKYMGVLMIDSCLMLCANWSYAGDTGGHMRLLSPAHHRLRDVVCGDPETTKAGNEQYEWINATMNEWANDDSIVWKATALHHPMWGKWYPDFANIVSNYLPLLQEFKFDVYFNGHEHVISYAHYDYSQVPYNPHYASQWMHYELNGYECGHDLECFFNHESAESRQLVYQKGDALHQVNTGMSGFDSYSLCLDRPTMGVFTYAQNVHKAWSQVHVQEDHIRIVSRAVIAETREIIDLYELVILNEADADDVKLIN